MFEQDYLMRIIAQLLGAIRRSMERAAGEEDPDGPRAPSTWRWATPPIWTARRWLSLAPESLASVLQVSGVDPHLTEYIARSLMLSVATTVRRDGRMWPSCGRPRAAPSLPPSATSWEPTP